MNAFGVISNNWFARISLILVSFLILQSNVIAVTASPIILEQDNHTGISEVYTYDEIENLIWAECDHSSRVNRDISKSEVGSKYESTLLNVRNSARGKSLNYVR